MQEFQIRDYDRRMMRNFEKAERELSKDNLELIRRYDAEMATLGLKKSTRAKQIGVIIDITIRVGKDWKQVTKADIDGLIRSVIDEFGDNLGGETETTRDYKKFLKPFFRWVKLGTRDYREAGDPPELKSIRLKQVKDKIVWEQLLTEDDHKKLLEICADNARDRAFFDVHYEAGTRPGEILSLKVKHVKFEDKRVGIKRVKGRVLWISCGYESQPQTLQKAHELGLMSGVYLTVVEWGSLGTEPKAVFSRGSGQTDGTRELYSKFYRWGKNAFPSNSGKQIRLIDNFNALATILTQ